jgi:hypothetical protein
MQLGLKEIEDVLHMHEICLSKKADGEPHSEKNSP